MVKSWWQKLDYILILLVLLLVVFGLVIIYSANKNDPTASGEFKRQIIYFIAGLFLLAAFASVDYHILTGFEKYFYIINVLILIAVFFVGQSALGAQRWLSVGFFSFQPSELAKIFIILSLAARLSRDDALSYENLAVTFLYIGFPIVLILMQPDLGSALVLLAILFCMLFVRGANPLHIAGLIVMGLAASPFVLKDYQKQRLLVFIHPESDPTGAGWNIIQSVIGIGSGRLWGKGLFSGTQTQLRFVPEHSTDFIFTVLGEELGFMGAAALIILYFFFLWKIIRIARESKDLTGTMIAAGIAGMFFFHIFVNLGMTMGIMPVTGIPLSFISYGGSSLITNMIAVGLLLNISMRRELFFKDSSG